MQGWEHALPRPLPQAGGEKQVLRALIYPRATASAAIIRASAPSPTRLSAETM